MSRGAAICMVAIVAAAATVAFDPSLSAHKTAVSPYTFHRDVLPIFEARCARCHGEGAPSGLSLLRYESARAAAWPLRQQLVAGHMPPWFAEGAFASPPPLSARELNVLITWATGGTPEGAAGMRPAAASPPSWAMGTPDLAVTMPTAFTFDAEQGDRVHQVPLPSARIGGRMIRAVDLLPGTPSLVRSAEIVARSGTREQVLGLWQPGEAPPRLAANAGFRLPSNAQLLLRIHYRRLYGAPESDRSQVGIYFAPRGAPAVESLELGADAGSQALHRVAKRIRAVAIRPVSGPSGTRVRLTVIGADASRKQLALLRFEKGWNRRYIFNAPVTLPAGSRIEISVIPSESRLWTSLTGEPIEPEGPVRVALEFVD